MVQHFMLGRLERAAKLLLHGRPHRRHERAPGASRRHVRGHLAAHRWPRSSAFASAWAGSSSGCPRHGTDFNHDFAVELYAGRAGQGQRRGLLQLRHAAVPATEAPGVSLFYQDDAGEIFHTYSTYGRGVEVMMGTYNLLDLAPKGRDEDAGQGMGWVRRHDRYEPAPVAKAASTAGSCCSAEA